MSLILHLSDLHLLPTDSDEPIGDYKSGFVPPVHRQKRADLLADTLRGLGEQLRTDRERLDAIVVSGDVTTRGVRAGFELLPGLLSQLGEALPDPDAIVVVPGNHDAAYRTPPSTLERYKHFVEVVRAQGYVTPILEGVDDPDRHVHCLVRDDFVICAVNSADYAGALEPLSPKIEKQLRDLQSARSAPQELIARFEELRTVDAARINPIQLRRMSTGLRAADPEHERVRIVTFHHQLQPVTVNEELKPFEALSNLAEVQAALQGSGVDVVLHGHKHSAAMLDLAMPSLTGHDQKPHPCRVLSVGTVGGQVGVGNEVAKLLRIEGPAPRTRTITVYSVPALSAGGQLGPLVGDRMTVSSPAAEHQHTTAVHGRSIADVHEQIIVPEFQERVGGPIVCVVHDPTGWPKPPATYPTGMQADDLAVWFEGQVRWWQSDTVAEGKPFTHGDYIRRWHGVRDQLDDAVGLLRASPQSSRALVTLHDPDRVDRGAPFPSFSMLHLKVRNQKLEMLAFFRKHEMRYWWAINVAEIALMQAEVITRLSEPGREITAGPIVTVSAEAVFSASLPKVAVPHLDQHAWNGSPEIARIAAAIFDGSMPDRKTVLGQAVIWFEELAPPMDMPSDGPYIATAGPAELLKLLTALGRSYPDADDPTRRLIETLESFVEAQEAGMRFGAGDSSSGYAAWAVRCRRLTTELTEQLRQL